MTRTLPDELRSDSERLANQPLSMVDAVRRQIDRIAYLRSAGSPWAEAVQQLRDMLVGLEDEEFWDGIPRSARDTYNTALATGDEATARRIRVQWAPHGWNGVPVRALPGRGGRPIWRPTPENLSVQFRLLMSLLDRRGLLWRTRRTTSLPKPPEVADDPAGAALHVGRPRP